MRKFLKNMVDKEKYKNSSFVLREALTRMMNEEKDGDLEAGAPVVNDTIGEYLPKFSSSILITIPRFSEKLLHKLNKLELLFHKSIVHRSEFSYRDLTTITYILDDSIYHVQEFITELNGIEDVMSFRYVINEPEE